MAVVNAGDPVLGTVHKKGPNTILAIVIAALVGFPATLFWGWLTDRVGRRPVYLFGTAMIVLFGIPMFLLLNTGQAELVGSDAR